MKSFLTFVSLLLSVLTADAVEKPFKLTLNVNDADGIILNENTVEVYISVENTTADNVDFKTHWYILTDDWQPIKSVELSHVIHANQKMRIDCPLHRFARQGFYRIQARVSSSFGDTLLQHVIGIDPEKIEAPINKQEDFELFWNNALDELEAIKPEYKVIPVEREEEAKTNLYQVEIKSYGNLTVRGWLEVPKKKEVYPALLRVPGYTENMEPIDRAGDMIVFSFNTRDHGESDDSDGGRSWDMWVRGFESKENYYYKGLFLDCIRALDYLCTRSDVDTNRIAVWGGSQGGGLSFATAALDERIALCIADIPYMCEYPRYFEITYWQEVSTWFESHPEATWQTILNTLSYYDTKNFAHKITCPVWMGIGLQDDVCPPATSFVTYNKIKTEKNYVVYKDQYHWQPDEHYERRFKELRKFFLIDSKLEY